MAEIIQRDGAWDFDGETLRITPGLHRSVPLFRQTYGEIAVPVEAIAGVVFESERRRGRLRLRLRDGADPLLQATGGRLPEPADPYRLRVDGDRSGAAGYLAEEIRRALLLDQVPREATSAYLLPGPPVPVTVRSSDGTVFFDGTRVRIDWTDTSDRVKREAGPQILALDDLVQVEWLPKGGYGNGHLRFVTWETAKSRQAPEKDPFALDLWGSARKDLLTASVAAAVTARLPHPSTKSARPPGPAPALQPPATPSPPGAEDHDVLLRRLRELGELHRAGVLTDEEFRSTKSTILKDF